MRPHPLRWARRLVFVVVLLLIAAVISSFITLNDYAIVPGTAQDVSPLIGVPAKFAHAHSGNVLLTDVELVQVRAIDYLYYRYLDSDADLVPTSELTGPVDIATYDEQGVIDMATARQAATVVALRTLGYKVSAKAGGAIVYQVEQSSAVSGILSVGDVIVSFAGHPVTTLDSLLSAIGEARPGQRVRIVTHRIEEAKTTTRSVVLGLAHIAGSGEAAQLACLPNKESSSLPLETRNGRSVPCLGIEPEQLYLTTRVPFSVNINPEGIIGPSAGLAFSLGLIAKLDPKDLTGGKKVAATGTISINGAVGDVGGVAQKTVAVERAGASIFFVPTVEYKVAEQHATKGLKVYAVSSLASAVAILKRLGGEIASPPSS